MCLAKRTLLCYFSVQNLCVYLLVHMCVHVCLHMWRTEADIEYLPQLLSTFSEIVCH